MAYFSTFSTYSPQKQLPLGQPNRAINVMYLAKNVMSFYLLDPMNGPHTWGKRAELYSDFQRLPRPMKSYKNQRAEQSVPGYGSQVRRPLNRDVQIF